MAIIGWIVFGLIAGAIARLLMPGRDPMGWLATIALGIIGSVVGGGLAYVLKLGTDPYAPAGWIFSILGALLTLTVYYKFSGPRVSRY
ncbi:MAG: GlsB/YeaQ/YmgE family stress response membrane protein [Planctomycetia bacterium]|nr:GlsB/YeaQ/YmgE family stress response membrane protein [Planctomycetia bacterium]